MSPTDPRDIRRGIARVVAVAAAGSILYALAPLEGGWGVVSLLIALALQVLIAPFTYRRIRRVMTSDRPVVEAAIAITGLGAALVLGFALIYAVLAEQQGEMVGLETKVDAVYFTVTTLATVGTGDVHASGQTARAVATVNILINVLVLAVAVRMLATVAVRRQQATTGGPPSDLRG